MLVRLDKKDVIVLNPLGGSPGCRVGRIVGAVWGHIVK